MAGRGAARHKVLMVEQRISRNGEKRESIFARADVRREGATDASTYRVRNISPSGACIDHGGELRLGARLRLTVGWETDVPATVAWARRDSVGVRFERVISTFAAVRRCAPDMAPANAGWLGNIQDAYRAA